VPRQFTIDNLTAKQLSLVMRCAPVCSQRRACAGLAPNASATSRCRFCRWTTATDGHALRTGTPTDGSRRWTGSATSRDTAWAGNARDDGRLQPGGFQLRPGASAIGAEILTLTTHRLPRRYHSTHHQRMAVPIDHDLRHNACAGRVLHGHAHLHADHQVPSAPTRRSRLPMWRAGD